jgi:hypothetical protein
MKVLKEIIVDGESIITEVEICPPSKRKAGLSLSTPRQKYSSRNTKHLFTEEDKIISEADASLALLPEVIV